MSPALKLLCSLLLSGLLLVGQPIREVTPQHNPDDLLLVNRQWRISRNYYPEVRLSDVPGQIRSLRPVAAEALEAMFAACKEETGAQLISVSGYRNYAKQEKIYGDKLKRVNGSRARADEYVARPGASEHQTGLTMDLGQKGKEKSTLGASFGETPGGIWLRENCWRFGFILRYDQGWEETTGYSYEPWHVRYVGLRHAQYIHEHPMPLEDYLQLVRTRRLKDALLSPGDLVLEEVDVP